MTYERLREGEVSRRRFLAFSGGVAVVGLLPAGGVNARPRGPAGPPGGGFAVIADTHMDPFVPQRTEDLKAVFEHIGAREGDPAFVFHVGDVVEAGFPEEYEEFERAVPAEFEDSVLAVPGNHEVRWDEWAKELYFERFRQTPYSFDAGGVHFVALDPTNLLQEPGYFSDEQLRWLERDLKRAGRERPAVVYIHYPMGRDNYYVGNQDDFFRVVEPYNVRAVVAGHIHREEVARQNGMTVITLPAIRNTAVYDWVEFSEGRGAPPSLTFSRAERDRTTGAWSETLVAEVPLTGERPAESERPRKITFDPAGASTARLTVRMAPRSRATGVSYRFWPEYTWAGKNSEGWAEATKDGDSRWRASVVTSSLATGSYRLQVRATDPSGAYWDAYDERVEVPGRGEDAPRVLGERTLGAAVQAGLAEVPARGGAAPLAVAATTAGRVVGLRARGGGIKEEWSFEAGEAVIGTPAVGADGGRVFVGSADHNVYALDAASGERLWRAATERPALGNPLWTESPRGGEGLVLAPAGTTLYAFDAASGETVWRADSGGFIGGRAASDGRAAYVGAGDGKAYAFYLGSGEKLWERVVSQRETPYSNLIYSPWKSRAAVLPGSDGRSLAVVSNVVAAYALDTQTGEQVWSLKGGFMYGAPLNLPDLDRAVLTTEFGDVVAINPATGAELWRVRLAQRVIDPAPVLWDGAVVVTGVNGLLAFLDPATGQTVDQLHLTPGYAYSTPAVLGEALLVGGQDGAVRIVGAGARGGSRR